MSPRQQAIQVVNFIVQLIVALRLNRHDKMGTQCLNFFSQCQDTILRQQLTIAHPQFYQPGFSLLIHVYCPNYQRPKIISFARFVQSYTGYARGIDDGGGLYSC